LLNITNGDCAVERLVAAGVHGDLICWRDVLHEGPIPEGLSLEELSEVRARFIASQGWGALGDVRWQFVQRDARVRAARGEDVVLWFEHDLYDQLQLIQVLDWFAANPPASLSLACEAVYLGDAEPARILALPVRAVTDAQLELAQRTWDAVREDAPHRLVEVAYGDCDALPFLGAALRRLLEELPGACGLSRTERAGLAALRGGCESREAAFAAVREEPIFLGDATFFSILDRLRRGPSPLLDGLLVTEAGCDVLDGRRDWAAMGALDRWLGGMRLVGPRVYRWDRDGARLVEPD
jgi:hypothetical protein